MDLIRGTYTLEEGCQSLGEVAHLLDEMGKYADMLHDALHDKSPASEYIAEKFLTLRTELEKRCSVPIWDTDGELVFISSSPPYSIS